MIENAQNLLLRSRDYVEMMDVPWPDNSPISDNLALARSALSDAKRMGRIVLDMGIRELHHPNEVAERFSRLSLDSE